MIQLMKFPYATNAFEPYISARTIEFHYGAHHKTYVNTLNILIQGTDYENQSLEEIICATHQVKGKESIFNNAAQVWNHDFYWKSLCPVEQCTLKEGALKDKLIQTFGSIEAFAHRFQEVAISQFGSGWCWLVCDSQGNLDIQKTPNADLPLVHGQTALLTCDVWEHAYYLDYQNKRPEYLTNVLDNLLNWQFAAENYRPFTSQA